jgi:hypothetical protein
LNKANINKQYQIKDNLIEEIEFNNYIYPILTSFEIIRLKNFLNKIYPAYLNNKEEFIKDVLQNNPFNIHIIRTITPKLILKINLKQLTTSFDINDFL